MIYFRHFNPRTPYGVRQPKFSVCPMKCGISIHALHTECDHISSLLPELLLRFQSTHSIRSATAQSKRASCQYWHFNPRTPYGVRLEGRFMAKISMKISIHALHTECDWRDGLELVHTGISIHALHTECDQVWFTESSQS
ncbi:hypothetical protein PAEAM_06050 [Paenibacillus sp. GM1FR]|nr:hypothetical protein PAEAM_06050 [Paenibacillus sp. GM1FR]